MKYFGVLVRSICDQEIVLHEISEYVTGGDAVLSRTCVAGKNGNAASDPDLAFMFVMLTDYSFFKDMNAATEKLDSTFSTQSIL
jgi:hypothetical protein